MREKGTLDSSGLVYNKVREFCYCVMRILTRHDALLYKLLPSSPLLQTELEDCESTETQRSELDFYHSEPSPLSQLTTISGFNCETCQTSNKTKYSLFLDQYTTPKAQQQTRFTTTDILFTSCMVLTRDVKSNRSFTTVRLEQRNVIGQEPSQ